LRDPNTGDILRKLTVDAELTALAFSADGRTLGAATRKGVILWEVPTGSERARFTEPHLRDASLAFSPDGRRLAFARVEYGWNPQKPVKVWDLATQQEAGNFHGHSNHVLAVAFSPDSTRLATASDDTTALVWDVHQAVKGGSH
jgi:WD40 repeat protein